jgi:adenylosuccinate synthase
MTGVTMKRSVATVCVWTLVVTVLGYGIVSGAESERGGEASFSEKVGAGAKKIGDAIANGIKKTAKKIEDKHVPEKVERKLKKAADKTAEGFSKAEKKIKQKLAD